MKVIHNKGMVKTLIIIGGEMKIIKEDEMIREGNLLGKNKQNMFKINYPALNSGAVN